MVMSSSSLDRTRQFFSARRDAASPASERPPARPAPGCAVLAGGMVLAGGTLLARGTGLAGGSAAAARPPDWRGAAGGAPAGRAPGRPGAVLRTCLTRDGT